MDAESGIRQRKRWCCGVLNEPSTDEVPGSVRLLAGPEPQNEPLGLDHIEETARRSSLVPPLQRKKTSSCGKIILQPQPDDSLNDPLNWPFWRRNAALLSLGFYCMLGGGLTPILAAGFQDVAQTFNVSVPKVAMTTGFYMMGLGIGGVLMSPTAIVWGKRPVYLLTAIALIGTSIWCAMSTSYGSLVAARIFQGICVSPIEVMPSATVAEIFFLHERASKLGVYTLLLLGGKHLIPLLSAVIIQAAGWRWVFGAVTFTALFCLILLFLFVPESYWDRTPRPKAVTGGIGNVVTGIKRLSAAVNPHSSEPRSDSISAPENVNNTIMSKEEKLEVERVEDVDTPNSSEPEKTSSMDMPPLTRTYTDHWRERPVKTFKHSLTPYHGRLNHDKWLTILIRPFMLFSYPAILWSALTYSMSIGWLVVLSETVSVVYRDEEKYNFTALQTGLVYVSPFIGSIFGTLTAGKLSNWIVQYMAKKNDGVYEPEFRLVMAIPIAIATTAGLMGFGWSAEEKDAWIVPTVFFGIIGYGSSLGSTTAITFCVDSYCQYAGEALVTLNFSKNIFHGLVFSLFFNTWLEKDGSKNTFIVIGCIQLACMLLTIPMFIYGKRLRMWTVRRNFMSVVEG